MTLIDTLIGLVDTPSETGNEGRLCTALAERLMRTHGQQAVRRIGNSLVVGRRTDRPMVAEGLERFSQTQGLEVVHGGSVTSG